MTKRAFERRDGVLFDSYEFPSGQKCRAQFSAQSLGEPLSDEQLQLARESSAQAPDLAQGAFTLRWEEKSDQSLEALLSGLTAGNIVAPPALLNSLDDPRVRPALIEAARRAAPGWLANVAQVVGIVGGAGARDVLRQRMEELSRPPRPSRTRRSSTSPRVLRRPSLRHSFSWTLKTPLERIAFGRSSRTPAGSTVKVPRDTQRARIGNG